MRQRRAIASKSKEFAEFAEFAEFVRNVVLFDMSSCMLPFIIRHAVGFAKAIALEVQWQPVGLLMLLGVV